MSFRSHIIKIPMKLNKLKFLSAIPLAALAISPCLALTTLTSCSSLNVNIELTSERKVTLRNKFSTNFEFKYIVSSPEIQFTLLSCNPSNPEIDIAPQVSPSEHGVGTIVVFTSLRRSEFPIEEEQKFDLSFICQVKTSDESKVVEKECVITDLSMTYQPPEAKGEIRVISEHNQNVPRSNPGPVHFKFEMTPETGIPKWPNAIQVSCPNRHENVVFAGPEHSINMEKVFPKKGSKQGENPNCYYFEVSFKFASTTGLKIGEPQSMSSVHFACSDGRDYYTPPDLFLSLTLVDK